LSLLLSIYLALHFAFWSWLVGLIKPKTFTTSWRNLLVAFLAACAWVTHEWMRGWLFSGFGWNGLGVALHAEWPMIQIAEFTGVIFERFRRLSEIALAANPAPDLLVWPESSMPDPVRDQNSESYRFITDFSAAMKTDLMLGTLDVDDGHEYNAALLVSNNGEQVQIYRKVHLVPFGEYIP